jgi:methyl-accepting chemotaxis protein
MSGKALIMLTQFYSNLRDRMLAAPIGTMLGIVLLLGLIPAFVMGGLYVQRGLGDVEVIDMELEGVKILKELKPVENFIINPPSDPDARKKQAAFAWQKVKSTMSEHGHDEMMQSSDETKALIDKLRQVAVGVEGVEASVEYSRLITEIGDRSGLILDPALDTYYLMTITLQDSYEINRLNRDLELAYLNAGGEFDPVMIGTRQRLGDATRKLRDAATSAVDGSKYDYLPKTKFMASINDTIKASNRMASAYGKDFVNAKQALDKANMQSWSTATYALKALLEQRRQDTINGIWVSLSISGAAGFLVIVFAASVIISIANGVRSISDRLVDLSAGDYISPVPGSHYRNDIGVIASALEEFISLSGKVDEERQQARAELEETISRVRAENEELLASALEQQRKASELERETLARLATDLERQLGELLDGSRHAAGKMDTEAAAMAERSNEIKREASSAANAAADIRRSVGSVPDTVKVVARSLADYTQALGEANQLAGEAAKRVANANRRMGDFSDATSKAAAMLDLIKSVAQKTNMLALNASIEAVRVGEAGTGFQVVANEVKALALSTRDAAAEIAQQIAEMKGVNHEVADAFGQVMQVVETLATQSAEVSVGMNDQAAAMNRVQSVVENATSELSTMVTSIEAADRSAAATQQRSSEMLEASRGVSENVGALDSSVRAFLGGIRNSRREAA